MTDNINTETDKIIQEADSSFVAAELATKMAELQKELDQIKQEKELAETEKAKQEVELKINEKAMKDLEKFSMANKFGNGLGVTIVESPRKKLHAVLEATISGNKQTLSNMGYIQKSVNCNEGDIISVPQSVVLEGMGIVIDPSAVYNDVRKEISEKVGVFQIKTQLYGATDIKAVDNNNQTTNKNSKPQVIKYDYKMAKLTSLTEFSDDDFNYSGESMDQLIADSADNLRKDIFKQMDMMLLAQSGTSAGASDIIHGLLDTRYGIYRDITNQTASIADREYVDSSSKRNPIKVINIGATTFSGINNIDWLRNAITSFSVLSASDQFQAKIYLPPALINKIRNIKTASTYNSYANFFSEIIRNGRTYLSLDGVPIESLYLSSELFPDSSGNIVGFIGNLDLAYTLREFTPNYGNGESYFELGWQKVVERGNATPFYQLSFTKHVGGAVRDASKLIAFRLAL